MRKTADTPDELEFKGESGYLCIEHWPDGSIFMRTDGYIRLLRGQVRRLRDWLTEVLDE